MSGQCDKIELFVDGELPPDEAESFRGHIVNCPACQTELTNLLQLKLVGARYVAWKQANPERARQPLEPVFVFRRWWTGLKMAAAFAAVAAAVILTLGISGRLPGSPWSPATNGAQAPGAGSSQPDFWAKLPQRRLEARIAYAPADKHRELASVSMSNSGAKTPGYSHAELARLEEMQDHRGLAAAYLSLNDPDEAGTAVRYFDGLEKSPDIENDLAVAALLRGQREEAIRRLDSVLDKQPSHTQARWNRGLVYRDLDLPMLAARDFREVAARREPGWAQEAEQRASALIKSANAKEKRFEDARKAGEALVSRGEPIPPEILSDGSPALRGYLYDAVQTRTSQRDVEALLPLARELDRQAGIGDVLATYVERVASRRDFSQRAQLAGTYARLRGGSSPDTSELQKLITTLVRSKEDDLLLGALVWSKTATTHVDTFEARAAALGDPWFQLLAAHFRARVEMGRGQMAQARQALQKALQICKDKPLPYRCTEIHRDLSEYHMRLHELDEAQRYALQGLAMARKLNSREQESQLLWSLAEIARLRGDRPLARAYLEETLERKRDKPERMRYIRTTLAHLELDALRFEQARVEIDKALGLGLPLTLSGSHALADIARRSSKPGDEAAIRRALAEHKAFTAGDRALAREILGRYTIEKNQREGREHLEEAIREAEAAKAGDENALKARAYAYAALISDASKAGDFGHALDLFGRELRAELPRRCMLAVTEDLERFVVIVRGPEGATRGFHDGSRTRPLPQDLTGVVPPAAVAALKGCEQVEVIARPPLHGRAGLLPPEFAWSYKTRSGPPPRPAIGKAIHLVVKNVELPPERRSLKRLNDWKTDFGTDEEPRLLEGSEATPSRVLAAMSHATEIDLVAHGIINPGSDASYLVLAPEGNRDELSSNMIREQRLAGAPLVILAACHAAHTAYVLHERFNLPAAFIDAGARGVFAATVEIPDLEAAEFFNSVRARIRQGTPPAIALRDERLHWLKQEKGRNWLTSVLVFE